MRKYLIKVGVYISVLIVFMGLLPAVPAYAISYKPPFTVSDGGIYMVHQETGKVIFAQNVSVLIVFMGLLPAVPAYAISYKPPFTVSDGGIYMVHQETGKVIFAQNEQQRFQPASLAKIMTAILTLENVKDLDAEEVRLKLYINEMILGTNSSLGGYWPGDTSTVRDALYALLLRSAGEVALMLADHVGDNVDHFVSMMNEKAKELGCTNTNFTNPHGLHDENQYTTAEDMAKIASYAMSIPEFAKIVSTPRYTVNLTNNPKNHPPTLSYNNTNELIQTWSSYYYSPVVGIKTGTLTDDRALAAQATKDGETYLLIQLGVPIKTADGQPTEPKVLTFHQAKELFKWVFDSFSVQSLTTPGQIVSEIPAKLSKTKDFVTLAAQDRQTTLLHQSIDTSLIEFVPHLPEYVVAPIDEGEVIGTADIMFAGEKLGEVNLVATEKLERSALLASIAYVQNVLHLYWVKFIISLLIISTVTLIIYSKKKNRHKNY